jgi:hypothetical protein
MQFLPGEPDLVGRRPRAGCRSGSERFALKAGTLARPAALLRVLPIGATRYRASPTPIVATKVLVSVAYASLQDAEFE